jgi:predicted small secreted protein
MKKDFLWFDEQLWSALCAGPKSHWPAAGSEHRSILSEPRTKDEGRSKGYLGRGGIQLILIALFLTTTVLGCNTMRGVGKDVEGGGRGIQRVVDHND